MKIWVSWWDAENSVTLPVTVTVTRELVPLGHVEYNIIGVLDSTFILFFYVF